MGHLITRMAAVRLEEEEKSSKFQSIVYKRKRSDHDEDKPSKRPMIIKQQRTKTSHSDDLSLSPRISPILTRISRSSASMTLFRCQLCRRCLKNKDHYMEHMITCAIQQQAPIKIIRSEKDELPI